MTSRFEAIHAALETLFATGDYAISAKVLRNADVKEAFGTDEILVIIPDGEAQKIYEPLGGILDVGYELNTDIEIYVQDEDKTQRDSRFDAVLKQINTALSSDDTLGGLVQGMRWSYPKTDLLRPEGVVPIKAGILTVRSEYYISTPI